MIFVLNIFYCLPTSKWERHAKYLPTIETKWYVNPLYSHYILISKNMVWPSFVIFNHIEIFKNWGMSACTLHFQRYSLHYCLLFAPEEKPGYLSYFGKSDIFCSRVDKQSKQALHLLILSTSNKIPTRGQ